MKVLFVCLGNICRSPTAEGVMAQLVEAAKLQRRYHVDSAGTGGWHRGSLPDPRTRAAAARRGLDLTHRARQLEADDLHRFDHVVCMDRSNLANVERLTKFGGPSASLWLLRQFDPELGDALPLAMTAVHGDAADVPDPYAGPPTGFEEVLDICERSCARLLAHLEALTL